MAITPASFKARFPEFASVSDARVQVFIDDAELELNETCWGDLYNKGLSYLTAHFLSLGEGSSNGDANPQNVLTSRSVGDVSVGFQAASTLSTDEAYFGSTVYGQEYWRMLMQVGMGAVAIP